MNFLTGLVLIVLLAMLMVLDIGRIANLMRLVPLTVILFVLSDVVLLGYLVFRTEHMQALTPFRQVLGLLPFLLLLVYLLARVTIFPVLDGHDTGVRVKLMIGGRFLVYRALWMMIPQALLLIFSYRPLLQWGVPHSILIANIVYSAVFLFALLFNGILRLFFTSRRLSIVWRVVMLLTMWIPLVNLLVLDHACRLARDEYDYYLYKKDIADTRVDSDLCQTKYPLLMVHGVLFRDLKYFNYWGRIPKELIRYGATIYYGNQEAVGTIEYNGNDIRARILEMLEETGSDKVNIIAHSKGGLDARHAISAYGLGDKVASLTTISTPHMGCRFIDKLLGILPDRFIRFLDRIVNKTFGRLGDKKPDFYNAVHQFTTEHSAQFNKTVTNDPQVYYQSYVSRMRSFFSDSLLCIPYLMIKPLEGKNDGLVSIESAKWGDFRGVLCSSGWRGISHGDIIDLKREDYRGYDVVEAYVGIVSDLKKKGF